jgi:hypothetical protein
LSDSSGLSPEEAARAGDIRATRSVKAKGLAA